MRASNIELLRIVAIIFIMLEHIVVFALNPAGFDIPKPHYVIPDSVANACISVFIVGVDIFVLISGYFTIKLSILKISKLWFCCAFYELFNFLSAYLILGDISKTAALKFLLPLSNGWFMPTYIALMIISPFLNSCLNSISKKQYFYCLILFTWMNVYFGFIMKFHLSIYPWKICETFPHKDRKNNGAFRLYSFYTIDLHTQHVQKWRLLFCLQ